MQSILDKLKSLIIIIFSNGKCTLFSCSSSIDASSLLKLGDLFINIKYKNLLNWVILYAKNSFFLNQLNLDIFDVLCTIYTEQMILTHWGKMLNIRDRTYVNANNVDTIINTYW